MTSEDSANWVTFEHRGPVTIIRLNRPEKLNAFHISMDETIVRYVQSLNLESTDRSLKGRAAGLAESSGGVPAFAGRCRSEEPSLSVAQRGSGALRAPARGCARRARACWREPRTRVGAVSERQAGSGNARNRARAAAHWPAQGQRFARCRVQRRAEWVSRPARAK